jgi:hypothetical protein
MSKILTDPQFYELEFISAIEKRYDAKYILESCIKNRDKLWTDFPWAIFYNETPHPQGSNYFAIAPSNNPEKYIIANAICLTERPIMGIFDEENDIIIFSRFRHDYRTSPSGKYFIDGGRDYTRCNNPDQLIRLKIIKDKIKPLYTLKPC